MNRQRKEAVTMRSIVLGALSLGVVLALAAQPAVAEEKAAPPKLAPIKLAVGQTVALQMTTKRPIKTIINDNDQVVRVTPTGNDPTTVLLTGLTPGRARITLIDADGKEESRDLGKPSEK
jgi:hypothetical protein